MRGGGGGGGRERGITHSFPTSSIIFEWVSHKARPQAPLLSFLSDNARSADQMIHLTITVSASLNYTSTVSDCFRPLINQLAWGKSAPVQESVASSHALAGGLFFHLGSAFGGDLFSLSLIKRHVHLNQQRVLFSSAGCRIQQPWMEKGSRRASADR